MDARCIIILYMQQYYRYVHQVDNECHMLKYIIYIISLFFIDSRDRSGSTRRKRNKSILKNTHTQETCVYGYDAKCTILSHEKKVFGHTLYTHLLIMIVKCYIYSKYKIVYLESESNPYYQNSILLA